MAGWKIIILIGLVLSFFGFIVLIRGNEWIIEKTRWKNPHKPNLLIDSVGVGLALLGYILQVWGLVISP